MGNACPFDSDELVFETHRIFTPDECRQVREEAAALMRKGVSASFTLADTIREVHVYDLPQTMCWLHNGSFAHMTSLAAQCFSTAVADPSALFVYDALVIRYDASAGLTHTPIHRDNSLITCVISLSEKQEYVGGGTFMEPIGQSIAPEQGCALLHASQVRHAGHRVTSGERWVLVLFLSTVTMLQGEHGRRFLTKAQELFEELEKEEEEEQEDDEKEINKIVEAEAYQCLLHALQVTDDSHHEVWNSLGEYAHRHGKLKEALKKFRNAEALYPLDADLLDNMGVLYSDLGRPREAFNFFRRALVLDPYDVHARVSAAQLLEAKGRFHGIAALLADAPQDAMQDEELQRIAERHVQGGRSRPSRQRQL